MTQRLPIRPAIRSGFWATTAAIYLIVLICGTHWPGEVMPPEIGVMDKALHLAAYGVLAFLICQGLQPGRGQTQGAFLRVVVLAVLLIGAVDELTQWPVPGRYPDPLDWVADAIGTFMGIMTFLAITGFVDGRVARQDPARECRPTSR